MNTTMITGICVCIILCLLAALALVLAACRAREKKLLKRLQEMLEDAAAGTFSEGKLEVDMHGKAQGHDVCVMFGKLQGGGILRQGV